MHLPKINARFTAFCYLQYFMYPILILYDTVKSIINAIKKGIRKPLIANTMSG